MSSEGRYYSITLEQDPADRSGVFRLKFATMPGMSTSITELHMADLDALAGILADRAVAASVGPLIATPRPPHPGEPCAHCGGVGSAHVNACDPD